MAGAVQGQNGKLTWAGRAWVTGATGGTRTDDAASDAVLFGFSGFEDGPAEDEGLWADHQSAFLAFLSVCTQWRVVASETGLIHTGLDYAAADAGLKRAGIETTPDLWADLRIIETGALAALREERS